MAEERDLAGASRGSAASRAKVEPRWLGIVAMLVGAVLHAALPSRLSLGPDWALFVVTVVLVIPIFVLHGQRKWVLARKLTFVATGALTFALIASMVLLISGLPAHKKDDPATLLRSAGVLWLTNVLVFALWYWKLDVGGPLGRERCACPIPSAFLFPQYAKQPPDVEWSPEFLDYLFVAFNTSTAFSPTDTPVLHRWAKVMTMIQSLFSLTILAVLAARAINVL